MKRSLLLLAWLFLFPLLVHGGVVSMSITALDSDGGNIANDGSLGFAWNANGDAASPPMVNGITFTNSQPASVTIAGFPAAVHEGSAASPSTLTADHYAANMAEIMGDYLGTASSTNGTVTLSGLTVGTRYRVQFLHHQDINDNSQRQVRVLFGTGPSATAYAGAGDNTGCISTVVFNADSATQSFTLNPASGSRAILNGVVLHQVVLSVNTPVSRQVLQRDASNTADIPIAGSYFGSFDRIEARAVVMAGTANNGATTAWSTIASNLSGGVFSGVLNDVPAGGWYQIEVRTVAGGIPGNPAIVTRVGVGDVYLTAGQSNSANRGSPAYSPGEDRFSACNYANGAWTLAADPMPGASIGGGQGSVWSRVGEMLVDRDNVPVGMLCFAESGSNVTRWLPANNDLYPRMRTAVQRLPINGFKAILWHQGETNAVNGDSTANYITWLTTVISQSRADAGWTVPWYVAEVSYIGVGLTKEEPIAAAHRAIIYGDPQIFAGSYTDDFHQEGKLYDGVHCGPTGFTDHATQWAEILGGTPPLAPKNADFESNPALTDGTQKVVGPTDTTSPSVIAWRALNAANNAVADGSFGYYNPNSTYYLNTDDAGPNGGVLPNMSGRHVAFLSDSSANACFLQTRRALLEAKRTYTLTAAIGVRSVETTTTFGGAAVELLADGNVIATRTIDRAGLDALNGGNAAGTFTNIAVTYTSSQTVTPGKPLSIRIRKPGGSGTYLDFDNVRLTTTATPYASWQMDHFGSTATPAAAWNADPDVDTLANGIEYHLGIDPLIASTPPTQSVVVHDGHHWARYSAPLDPGVDHSNLGLWYSFDLSTWQPAATNVEGTVVEFRSANEWALEIATDIHPNAFFQLRAGPASP